MQQKLFLSTSGGGVGTFLSRRQDVFVNPTFGHSNLSCTIEYQTIIFIFLIAFNLLLMLYSQLFGTMYGR